MTYRDYMTDCDIGTGEKIRCVRREDEDYPEKLRVRDRMPRELYVLGSLPDPDKKSVAIVGARACSAYGRSQALLFGETLARAGVQVISGFASGIDSYGMQGAIQGGGHAFGVLGCGVDVCYPKSNRGLYRRILSSGGGFLSEYTSGSPPISWHFPIRNRMISGLADLVLVIEAKRKSGSLITADYALEQGVSVFAVPGRNSDALSGGTNHLIWNGAGIACSPDDILEELGLCVNGRSDAERQETEDEYAGAAGKVPEELSQKKAYRLIMKSLSEDEKNMDALVAETGLDVAELSGILVQLCLSGVIAERIPGYYSRV